MMKSDNSLVPWKYACDVRGCTCSPLRRNVTICMDLGCKKHDGRGKGVGEHSDVYLADDLEWIVVHSFSNLEPSYASQRPEFAEWTMLELYNACEETDDPSVVSRRYFDDESMKKKLRRYVSLYESSHSLLSSSPLGLYDLEREDDLKLKSLLEIVKDWCGPSIDPALYVVLLNQRVTNLTKKVNLLQNTVDIWKHDVKQKEKEITELKWKLRAKKKNLVP